MGFTFRFETLLKVRKIKEDMAQQEFSRVQRRCLELKDLKHTRIKTKHQMSLKLIEKMKDGLESLQVRQYQDYLSYLEDTILKIQDSIVIAENQLNGKRQEMLHARKEHKAMFRLKELDEDRYLAEQTKIEMRFIDEIAIFRHGEKQ